MLYGIPVLAVALLITRGLPLIGVGFDGQTLVNRLLEIAAGVFLLMGEGNPRGRFGYGWTVTGVYLIAIGSLWLVGANTGYADIITGSLAALAAVLLFTSGRNTYRQWTGTVLLALWLVDMALTDLIHLQFLYHAKITMGLAVAAGAFLLARR